MNDPHVVALFYQIGHGQSVDYREVKPSDHEEKGFRLKIADEQVCFEFKTHYATKDAARKAVEDYIREWEFNACLEGGPDSFTLNFRRAHIEDRKPPLPVPGVKSISMHVRAGSPTVTIGATVVKTHYPAPPSGVRVTITPDVQTMYDRYMGYCQRREPLTSMAYFCWSMIKGSPIAKTDLSNNVGTKIKRLSSEKGGRQARKADGKDTDLTATEQRFLEQAIKAVIRRTAERAHSPDRVLPQISLSGLPPV